MTRAPVPRRRTDREGRDIRRRKRTAALTGLAAACTVAIVVAATGSAWSNDGPDLSNVATANTKSVGYAPASKLSVELSQIAVAQRSTKAENLSPEISYYGYDNDLLNAAGDPQMLPTPGCRERGGQDRAGQEHLPRLQARPVGRRPVLRVRHALPVPGTRDAELGSGLHHAHQPRRRRRSPVTVFATKDATGAAIKTIDGSTWEP